MRAKLQEKYILFSVPLHPQLEVFSRKIIEQGWRIIATEPAYSYLRKRGLMIRSMNSFTGMHFHYPFPDTLSPKVEAALTLDIPERIDALYEIPYPLSEGNDVGGMTLVALALKGKRVVMTEPAQMRIFLSELEQGRCFSVSLRESFSSDAYRKICQHYLSLAQRDCALHDTVGICGSKIRNLSHGENPYQKNAAFYALNGVSAGVASLRQVLGVDPCYTNLADVDSLLITLGKLQEAFRVNQIGRPYIAVSAKHGNACGIGVSLCSPFQALLKAFWGNPRAIWGGECIVNFPIDEQLAEMFLRSTRRKRLHGSSYWMFDVVIAPRLRNGAKKILGVNSQRKVFLYSQAQYGKSYLQKKQLRILQGGFLVQDPPNYILRLNALQWFRKPKSMRTKIDLLIAWAAAYTSFHGGNEIAVARNGMLLAAGGGPSTFDAAQTLVQRARECGHLLQKSAFCANAFFPFPDSARVLIRSGCDSGVVPEGGKRFAEVSSFLSRHTSALGFIPFCYRGFCRH